jgi:hypothetical protein
VAVREGQAAHLVGEPLVVALLLLAGLMHASWTAGEVRHVGTLGVFMATGT